MNGTDLSSRAIFAAVVACAVATASCTDDAVTHAWYLGPVEAGVPEAGEQPEAATPPPPVSTLVPAACSALLEGPEPDTLVRSAAALNNRLVLTTTDGVEAWQIDAQGCPAARLETFGVLGRVSMQALSAAPLPGGRAIAAGPEGTVLLDSLGDTTGSCLDGDAQVRARWVAADGQGKVIALLVRSPIERIVTDLAEPSRCEASKLELSPEAFVVLAMAYAFDGSGFVALEQPSASAPIALSRYDASGVRTVTRSWPDEAHPGHLCSGSGIVETPFGLVVADSVCGRVVVYDNETLEPRAEARLEGTPRAMAYTGEGSAVLVAVTSPGDGGAQATFLRLPLQ